MLRKRFSQNETVFQVRGQVGDDFVRAAWIGGRRFRPFVFYCGGGLGAYGNGLTLSRGPLRNPSTSARFATMLRSACVAESRSNRIQRVAPRTAPGSSSNESALPQRPRGSRNFAASRWSAPHFVQGGSPALATTLRFPRVGAHRRTQFSRFGHPARGLSIWPREGHLRSQWRCAGGGWPWRTKEGGRNVIYVSLGRRPDQP